MEQEKNTLSVLQIAPGQHPQQVEIDNDLKALQQAVGGSIGASYPFEDPVAIVYNDDGKLMGLPLNRALRDENGEMYDAVAGTFLVVGLGEEDFASLTPEMAQKYEQLFHQPEAFLKLGNRLLACLLYTSPSPRDGLLSHLVCRLLLEKKKICVSPTTHISLLMLITTKLACSPVLKHYVTAY